MNVLSLFDGASCAMVCLKRAGIPIENYYGADIKLVYSTTEIATLVQNQPTRAGEGAFILTNDPSKTPYRRVKTESMYKAGYDAFRCPTQAELARFHTYPVEVLQNFSPAQAQSLMGDGWHCWSIQWLFDKLKETSGE